MNDTAFAADYDNLDRLLAKLKQTHHSLCNISKKCNQLQKDADIALVKDLRELYARTDWLRQQVDRLLTREEPETPNMKGEKMSNTIPDEAARERLRKQIDAADVSEAAKEFYRGYLSRYRSTGGWGDAGYDMLKELDKAGLIMTTLVYLDHETSDTAD